jgi:magnesium-protoporphyrin IX monomethyl ester (oxidative) cyclase
MKIVLIQPDMDRLYEHIPTSSLRKPEYRMPIGLLSIATVLEDEGHEVLIIDNYIDERPVQLVCDEIESFSPDVLGISVMTTNLTQSLQICDQISQVCINTMIIMGGVHATIKYRQLLTSFSKLNAVIVGEGELSFRDFLNAIQRGRDWTTVKGIATLKDGDVQFVPRDFLCLDLLPIPRRSLLDVDRYQLTGSTIPQKRVFTLFSSRGCPYKCAFCCKPNWQQDYRYSSTDRVLNEAQLLISLFDADGLYFREDNFTASRARVQQFCKAMKNSEISISWECESRVDSIDRSLLEQMYDSGCRGIWFGIESGVQCVLDRMKKGTTVKQAHRVMQWCNELGIATGAMFMLGFPGETETDAFNTYAHAVDLAPTAWCGFQAFVGFPGAEIYNEILNTGQYRRMINGILEIDTDVFPADRVLELELIFNQRINEELYGQ